MVSVAHRFLVLLVLFFQPAHVSAAVAAVILNRKKRNGGGGFGGGGFGGGYRPGYVAAPVRRHTAHARPASAEKATKQVPATSTTAAQTKKKRWSLLSCLGCFSAQDDRDEDQQQERHTVHNDERTSTPFLAGAPRNSKGPQLSPDEERRVAGINRILKLERAGKKMREGNAGMPSLSEEATAGWAYDVLELEPGKFCLEADIDAAVERVRALTENDKVPVGWRASGMMAFRAVEDAAELVRFLNVFGKH